MSPSQFASDHAFKITLLAMIASVVMLAVIATLYFDAADDFHSSPYYNECTLLSNVSDISLWDGGVAECMTYATENQDATGADIVKALTGETLQKDFDMNVVSRPLNP